MKHNRKFIFLAKLGIVESTDEHGNFQIQRIDEPNNFAFDNGLDFIPPFLESDLKAEQIYNGVPVQMWEHLEQREVTYMHGNAFTDCDCGKELFMAQTVYNDPSYTGICDCGKKFKLLNNKIYLEK